MGIKARELLRKLPKERQNRIREKAKKYLEEYESLQEFRKAIGLTQSDVAKELGTNQVNISKLEGRKDMRLSTLQKYVEALGCELEINIRIAKDQSTRFEIRS